MGKENKRNLHQSKQRNSYDDAVNDIEDLAAGV